MKIGQSSGRRKRRTDILESDVVPSGSKTMVREIPIWLPVRRKQKLL